ncbi:hypothetical protein ACIRRA_38485 [Nocardia sp. NPDC101769]
MTSYSGVALQDRLEDLGVLMLDLVGRLRARQGPSCGRRRGGGTVR